MPIVMRMAICRESEMDSAVEVAAEKELGARKSTASRALPSKEFSDSVQLLTHSISNNPNNPLGHQAM